MYELIQISNHAYYMDCPSKAGLIHIGDGNVVAIDSGNDKTAGKKLLKILNENNWNLQAIYNTHFHADHIGGNKYLQDKTGCKAYASGTERELAANPILEPSLLYGGFPFKELHHKFLLAQKSDIELLTHDKLPKGIEVIPLPGHTFNMVGFRTDEEIVYLADSLSSQEALDKYKINVIWDISKYLETLEKIKAMQGKLFVPSHAAPTENIVPLAQHNIECVLDVADKIEQLTVEPITFEVLLQKMFEIYKLTMTTQQYVLIGCTLRSYLSWLYECGRVTYLFEDNRMLWRRA